jgi:hypothetical protein
MNKPNPALKRDAVNGAVFSSTFGHTKMKQVLTIALLVLSQAAFAGIVPASARGALLKETLQGFWGRAKTPDGKFIQPSSDAERQAMPVNQNVANFAFDVGEISGLAEWCGIDWHRSFTALMRQARQNNQTEKQIAFIAAVHGTALGLVSSSMAKSGQCSSQERYKVKAQIESFLALEPK